MSDSFVDVGRIEKAAALIDPVFRDTPQFPAPRLGDELGFEALLKVETINPIRCFKGRGTDFLVRTSDPGEVLVCASAGNLGQGLAFAASGRGLTAKIFAAGSVNPRKLSAMRRFGASVGLVDGDFDAARDRAAEEAARHGWKLVEDGSDPPLAEGAGTIAVELTRAGARPVDHVLVPTGNGSLACGVAAWFKAVSPSTKVIAVGAAGAPAMEHAWRTGDTTPGGPTTTLAEGLAARVPAARAVRAMRSTVDDFVLVDDGQLVEAVRLLVRTTGLVAEPSGAAAVAAAVALRRDLAGANVAMVITGANIAPGLLPGLPD
ncbi:MULTISPECIES: threonine ammonia-lyase [Thermomonosporaceae]|uniref:threonine ammonia-lyase n=1 Tax=Thermomonosporaceae TaxID=2012 RepID=UPI00255AC8E0|nr:MULTISPECIES: pyridoxal-phosphate dependent enzyme [Thermomonosporaceae]MDL4770785.1 pyridoxal-phosphate dependent enzyme [Actinomadura xylanilytica]